MSDEKQLVARLQSIAADCAEWMERGEALPPKHQRAAIRMLWELANAQPKHIHALFDIPLPGDGQPDRLPGHQQRYAHLMHKFGWNAAKNKKMTIEDVAEALDVPRGKAERLINAGDEQHRKALREYKRRHKP